MAIRLGGNQYGKAEVRLVRVTRGSDRHQIKDLNVSTALRGDFTAAHVAGDNSHIVATDTQKNTVYAFAQRYGVGEIEEFALRLGRHFVVGFEWVTGAKVGIEEYAWDRIPVDGAEHGHAFSRAGGGTRTTDVTVDGEQAWVVSGLTDLVVLKSAGSEFWGFVRDRYTSLAETTDRILATAVTARWRYVSTDVDWGKSYAGVRRILIESFAGHHSLALQQTLYHMGEQVLGAHPEVAEIRMSMPNRHHFLVDLSPFGLPNDNEVYYAADRPYGLIEGTVARDDAPAPGRAWDLCPEAGAEGPPAAIAGDVQVDATGVFDVPEHHGERQLAVLQLDDGELELGRFGGQQRAQRSHRHVVQLAEDRLAALGGKADRVETVERGGAALTDQRHPLDGVMRAPPSHPIPVQEHQGHQRLLGILRV